VPPGNGYIVQNWQAPLGELNLVKRHSVWWSPKDVSLSLVNAEDVD
jgi:hypothetical protein